MDEKIIIQIATIPERLDLLKLVLQSVAPQGDEVNVMLNGHKEIPEFIRQYKNVHAYKLDNSKGDAAKFYGLKGKKGYIFTCDDDLIYPPDYVSCMIDKLKLYDNRVILTNHGRIMNPRPVTSIYSDRMAAFHCLLDVEYDVKVDIGGSGVMAWHSDYFFPDYDRIDKKNMADIWVAKFAHEQGCRIMVNAHKDGWLRYLQPEKTIWDYAYYHPEEATNLYNSICEH